MATNTVITAVGGDAIHKKVALSYLKQGIGPESAIEKLKAVHYTVLVNDTKYKVNGASIASIITGFQLLAHQVQNGYASITKAKGLTFKEKK